MRVRLLIAYDGTNYAGWQIQPNGVTIQETLERAIRQITGETVKVHGSGRTDQGVHAWGQVAHFDLCRSWETDALLKGFNAILPPDIRVRAVHRAPMTFHARRSARWKEYRYFIWNGPVLPPHRRLYCLHVARPLDRSAMRSAAELLIGQHDFAAFSANPDRPVESTIRNLFQLQIKGRGAELCIIARADGFLYKMVRSLVGHLIRVGVGEVAPEATREILASRERTARVPTAPPQGLFLWHVAY